VTRQRQKLKKGELIADKARRLDDLGIAWDTLEGQWEERFALLENYKLREGHCNVPFSHQEDGVKLGQWVKVQRKTKKKGKLIADRAGRLEGLGISWDTLEGKWEVCFAHLENYKLREGHCNVPFSHQEDGVNLGNWVIAQRGTRKKGKLVADRARRLDDLGIAWDTLEAQWEERFALLENYKLREGHCIVPRSHQEDGVSLGNWVILQRGTKKKGELIPDRARRLEDLGIVWDGFEAKWEERFALLENYKLREGHCIMFLNPIKKME
jgi:predicted Ser/Thr protein kinase